MMVNFKHIITSSIFIFMFSAVFSQQQFNSKSKKLEIFDSKRKLIYSFYEQIAKNTPIKRNKSGQLQYIQHNYEWDTLTSQWDTTFIAPFYKNSLPNSRVEFYGSLNYKDSSGFSPRDSFYYLIDSTIQDFKLPNFERTNIILEEIYQYNDSIKSWNFIGQYQRSIDTNQNLTTSRAVFEPSYIGLPGSSPLTIDSVTYTYNSTGSLSSFLTYAIDFFSSNTNLAIADSTLVGTDVNLYPVYLLEFSNRYNSTTLLDSSRKEYYTFDTNQNLIEYRSQNFDYFNNQFINSQKFIYQYLNGLVFRDSSFYGPIWVLENVNESYYTAFGELDSAVNYSFNNNMVNEVYQSIYYYNRSNNLDSIVSRSTPNPNGLNMRNTYKTWLDYSLSTDLKVSSEQSEALHIYPNPVKDFLYLENNLRIDSQLRIYDLTGKLIMISKFKDNKTTIDVSYLKHGVYFLVMNDESHKFIKY